MKTPVDVVVNAVDEELEQKQIAESLSSQIVDELIEQSLLREEFKKELTK